MSHNLCYPLRRPSEYQMGKSPPALWFREPGYCCSECLSSTRLLFVQVFPNRFHKPGYKPYPACKLFPDPAGLHCHRMPVISRTNKKESIFFGSALQHSFRYARIVFALSTDGMFLLYVPSHQPVSAFCVLMSIAPIDFKKAFNSASLVFAVHSITMVN